jgi:sugar phosphate isomerase/epimerase
MTNSDQTAHVVEAVDHPAIKMQFDTGALTINGEDPWSVLERCHSLIEHVHASEPDLVPLGDLGTDHRAFSRPLETLLPDATITIEMLATKDERHVESIERAVNVAVNAYGNTDY